MSAILLKLKLIGSTLLVLGRGVITPLALRASKRHNVSHIIPPVEVLG